MILGWWKDLPLPYRFVTNAHLNAMDINDGNKTGALHKLWQPLLGRKVELRKYCYYQCLSLRVLSFVGRNLMYSFLHWQNMVVRARQGWCRSQACHRGWLQAHRLCTWIRKWRRDWTTHDWSLEVWQGQEGRYICCVEIMVSVNCFLMKNWWRTYTFRLWAFVIMGINNYFYTFKRTFP